MHGGGGRKVSFVTKATTVDSVYVADTTQRYSLVNAIRVWLKATQQCRPAETLNLAFNRPACDIVSFHDRRNKSDTDNSVNNPAVLQFRPRNGCSGSDRQTTLRRTARSRGAPTRRFVRLHSNRSVAALKTR